MLECESERDLLTIDELRADALRLLEQWRPACRADRQVRDEVAAYVRGHSDALARHSAGGAHLTCSVMVVDPGEDRALLTLHAKFGRWMQLGGHFEATDTTVLDAAAREALEESGLPGLFVDPVPLGVAVFNDIACPAGSLSRHLDVRFVAYPTGGVDHVCSDESLELSWWPLAALPDSCDQDVHLLAEQALSRLRRLPRHR